MRRGLYGRTRCRGRRRVAIDAFAVIGDPVRRRILEFLRDHEEAPAGAVGEAIQAEFGITQAAVSQHLKALRDSGVATVRGDGTRRLYRLAPAPFGAVEGWLASFRTWETHLDALAGEIRRGKQERDSEVRIGEESGGEEKKRGAA